MKKIFAILLAVISIQVAFAQAPDATYRLIRQNYTFNADGSLDYNFRKEITLHANRAMTAYATNGETFIIYNPAYETLTINECYAVSPKGKKVVAPANAFIKQLPEGVANSARYNGLVEMAIVHTGLELEGTIVLDYTIHRTNNDLMQRIQLAEAYPVTQYEINIKAAPKYQYMVQTENLEHIKYTTAGDKGEFHLTAYNLPQMFMERYLPENEILYPAVYVSTMTKQDLEQVLSLENESLNIDYAQQLPDISMLLQQLKKDDDFKTIKAIRDWVIDYVTTINIPINTNVNHINTADITYKENCGTPESKAILIAAMLQKAGYSTTIQWGIDTLQTYAQTQYAMFNSNDTRIRVKVNNFDYEFNPSNKSELKMCHAAQEEMNIIDITRQLEYQPRKINDKYVKLYVPIEPRALNINLAYIAPYRLAPIQSQATNEIYHYTVELPKGAKLVGKKINKQIEKDSVGSASVKVYQKGSTLHIDRELINEQEIINPKNIIPFYEMIRMWETTREIIIKL